MNAIRIRKRIDAETVRHLPELEPMLGREVEMIVLDEIAEPAEEPVETMETFLGEVLHRPPPTPEELAELRELAKDDPALAALLESYENGGLNAEAIVALRARG
jgi:hypothetical protein